MRGMGMRESIYAALLLHKAGREITEESVRSVLSAAYVEVDDGEITKLVDGLQNIDLDLITGSMMPIRWIQREVESEPVEIERKPEVDDDYKMTGIMTLFGDDK